MISYETASSEEFTTSSSISLFTVHRYSNSSGKNSEFPTGSATVIADPVGNSLFFPLEFEYLWTVNSEILLDVVNSSDEAVSYEIMFHGFRILSGAVAEDVRRRG